jgi:hypothetical protein
MSIYGIAAGTCSGQNGRTMEFLSLAYRSCWVVLRTGQQNHGMSILGMLKQRTSQTVPFRISKLSMAENPQLLPTLWLPLFVTKKFRCCLAKRGETWFFLCYVNVHRNILFWFCVRAMKWQFWKRSLIITRRSCFDQVGQVVFSTLPLTISPKSVPRLLCKVTAGKNRDPAYHVIIMLYCYIW